MGDVIVSTLMHINDLPIPIPLRIHKQCLILLKSDYSYLVEEITHQCV